ncbi:hypothetical protein HN011_003736 [Eciton burchellii]|nr:hypothetical protein HN011_003736 [Eciton burchellii]
MSSIEDRYYKINRILLKIFGIWPYQNSKWMHIKALIITSIFLSGIFVQLAVFITHECTLKLIVNVLSFAFPTFFMLFMYDLYYFNIDVFKEILEWIYYDWKFIKSEREFIIMNDYASIATCFTQVFLSFAGIGIFATIIPHSVSIILDIILPTNETRAENLHILVEYFVDPSKYYILFTIHLIIFICLGILTTMSTALMLLSIGFHACALFKLANYRMEIIMDQNILHISSLEKEQIICKRIICAVDIHRRALEFCRFLIMNIGTWFLIVIVIGVISLTINLLRFLQEIMEFKIMDVFIPTALIFIHFCYLFFGNHIGQQITNHNEDVFKTIYNLPWYIAPLSTQKLFLFLLQKGNKNFYLSISGLFDASYQGFTSLSMTSISYFTVLYSIQ